MAEKMTHLQLAEKILQEENKYLTAEEIWQIVQQKGYDKYINTTRKEPWHSIVTLIGDDMNKNPDSIFIKEKSKPVKFYLKTLEISKTEESKPETKEVLTFLELIERVLKEEKAFNKEKALTQKQIWDTGFKKGYSVESQRTEPWKNIASIIDINIKSNPNSIFSVFTESRPRKFFLKPKKDESLEEKETKKNLELILELPKTDEDKKEKMTLLELAKKVLKEAKEPLSKAEIWDFALRKGYDNDINSKGKTPWQSISAWLYEDIKNNSNSIFIKTGRGKFSLKELPPPSQPQPLPPLPSPPVNPHQLTQGSNGITKSLSERDLHPFLAYFAFKHLRVYTKTIFHEKSIKGKSGSREWLHPDLVGVYFPIDDWQKQVLDFSKKIGALRIKLYSFEMKKELCFTNLRESFFQAVSNSSWANEGYLVVGDIDKDNEDFISELKRLSTSFGIGIIKINVGNPDKPEIIFPARYKSDIDWDTANKLAKENPDFKDFLEKVNSEEVRPDKYDKVYTKKELLEKKWETNYNG